MTLTSIEYLRWALRGTALTTTLALSAAFMPSLAFGAEDESKAVDAVEELDEVVVTGSRIRRTGLDTPTPTTVLDASVIEATGALNLNDILMELPHFGRGYDSSTGSYSFGNAGLNQADLRDLGVKRTLTLINGRRAIGTADDANFLAVDVGIIPTELVERIEVVTGGASAVYGADAVAGVVNFILKDNYEGMTARAQGGISERGDAANYSLSVMAGGNFNEDRGNIVFNMEYYKSEALYESEREHAGGDVRFYSNPDDTGPEDGIPDKIMGTDFYYPEFNIPNAGFWGDEAFYNVLNGVPTPVIPYDEISPYDWWLTPNSNGGDPGAYNMLLNPLERYTAYSQVRYNLTENITFKGSLRYARTKSKDEIDPVFAYGDAVSIDNPFVSDELRTYMTDNGMDNLYFYRGFKDFGPRGADITREFFSISAGLEGEFENGWAWDAYYQWGGTTIENTNRNDVIHSRYYQALESEIDPATGEIVCSDPSDGCVPLDPFGTLTSEMLGFIRTDHTTITRTEQKLVSIGMNGGLFDFPAGEVKFAVGAEYHKDSLDFKPSYAWENAIGFFASQKSPVNDYTEVKEAFAEVLVPVLKDIPLVQNLELEGAIRVADYRHSGSNTSWKIGGNWQPIDDIRFRAVFARAVRAPSLGEMFDPGSRGASSLDDPCDEQNVTANATRQANCAALGIPDDFVSRSRGLTTLVFSTGNENLDVEKADTLTLGVVLTPSFLPNLTLTFDYYDIDLVDGITRFGAQDTLDLCVDLPDLDNNFCKSVTRDPVSHDIDEVLDSYVNASGYRIKGIDFEANYRVDMRENFDLAGDLNFRVIGSYLKNWLYTDVAEDENEEVFEYAGEWRNPQWRVNLYTTYSNGPLSVAWTLKYTSAQNNDNLNSDEREDPNKVPAVVYNDLRADYQVTDNINAYFGIDNLFDKAPPLHPYTAAGTGIYSAIGRSFYGGVKVNF